MMKNPRLVWLVNRTLCHSQGCQRLGNGQGKIKFFKVREKSGNFILRQENRHFEEKSGVIEII